MDGLTGCTVIFIVSEMGFWAGHLWESSTTVDGASAFLHRTSLTREPSERPDTPDFKGVAIDIFTQPTPPEAESFISLPELKAKYDDPFAKPPDIYILTKAVRYFELFNNVTQLVRYSSVRSLQIVL